MTEIANGALGVDAVVQRFAEAERLLAEAGARVRAIAEAAESATSSSASLKSATDAIARLVDEQHSAVAVMRQALEVSTQSLHTAATFLANTDVSRLTDTVADLVARVDALQTFLQDELAKQGDAAARTLTMLQTLAAKVDQAQQLLEQRDAALAKIQQILAVLPPRVKKRLPADLL